MTEYNYTKDPCAIERLTKEIQTSSIVTALDHIDLFGSALSIFFKADLSDPDKTNLDSIVSNHTGEPLLIQDKPQQVVTQYELNDKTLKLSKSMTAVDGNGYAVIYCKVPGEFGTGVGRYVAGGYGISEDYDKDDYVVVRVEDKDRIIAMMVALAMDANATQPVSDETIQQMGVVPGVGEAFPAYPIIKSYTDEEADEANRGWYFWPLAQGNNLPPVGEVEVNPIGGYGFIPSGFYIKLIYQRPEGKTTGSMRVNIDWGRKE